MYNFYKILDQYFNSKYTNEHLIGNNSSYQKFILLTYRRTGANYFLDLLRSHPSIIAFAALFEKGKIGFIYPGYPSPFSKKTIKYRDNCPIDFLNNRIFGLYSNQINAVGFKIVYESGHPIVFDYLSKQTDVKFIHLQRRNILKLFLSDRIATKTNVWGVVTKENEYLFRNNKAESFTKVIEKLEDRILPDGFKIKLDYNDCLKEFIKIKGFANKYNSSFDSDRIINIYYEDLLMNLDEELKKVQSFLGVENHSLSSRFVKINKSKLSDIIENYAELKDRFAGTEWANFFED